MTLVSILIPAGTIVSGKRGTVTLRGDVYVDAVRVADGGYSYRVGGNEYYTCAAVATVLGQPSEPVGMVHRDGLIALVG